MTSITWDWQDFWLWYSQIEEQERQYEALREVHRDDFIKRLSAEAQAKVFLHAPLEFKQMMKDYPGLYKREAIALLQLEEDKKSKKLKKYMR